MLESPTADPFSKSTVYKNVSLSPSHVKLGMYPLNLMRHININFRDILNNTSLKPNSWLLQLIT